MVENRQNTTANPTLPNHASVPINHCNLPAAILGSLTFQRHPVPLQLDGVRELHTALFDSIDAVAAPHERAEHFKSYMHSSFLLDRPDEAGFDPDASALRRDRADYLRMLRGWLFDPDGKEAAVLKSWVESRFGLLPRSHHGALGDFSGDNYQRYLHDRAQGLYNSNALEAQLDLLYSYCQYELVRRFPQQRHFTLYRGINRIQDHEILNQPEKGHYTLLLNNLNSFTDEFERADEFGDYILQAEVPLAKILYLPELLPGTLKGENEFLVIGGVYQVRLRLM